VERSGGSQQRSTLHFGSAVCTGEVVGDLHAPVLGSVVLASATSWAMLPIALGNDPLSGPAVSNWVSPAEF